MKKILLLSLCAISYLGYGQCNEPLITDFECGEPSNPITGALVTVANPFPGGINTSENVGEYTDDGTQGFDNFSIEYGEPIDLSTNSVLTLKLYSPTSVQILAKLEGGGGPEIFSDFSQVNEWQEFSFDFSAFADGGNTRVVVFVNPAVSSGTTTDIYYVDDIGFEEPEEEAVPCEGPVITDFECSAPSQPITGAIVTVENPFQEGINTSENVGRYTDDGTNGFDALVVDYGTEIDLSTNPIFSVKLYSTSSVQILAKLEGGTAQEIYSDFSEVNQWQEFTFDFSDSQGNGNTRLALFVNPAVTDGTTTDVYFLDDLSFESATASIDENFLNSIKLYPNPAADILNISSVDTIESYQILDVSGKTIMSKNENISAAIDVNNLTTGIYFIRLNSSSSKAVIKFVKQ
ncbi:T9SS type A sorting domain-containing protein [Nonlabens ponticola]|uniref:T9SS type A sorting domain-containing protein n=1 Tax=Nonlabens ponticola TaxID=2496866 RepID=A0A3S9MUJ2_9FLAO|nr:T9SS type A sorting domain-containing protein [Nonlabens ponticola]AZQ42845.1 T9SS type A sorting domain-containing protein [Nonlabens ponticola]